jgi:hypothetical protein
MTDSRIPERQTQSAPIDFRLRIQRMSWICAVCPPVFIDELSSIAIHSSAGGAIDRRHVIKPVVKTLRLAARTSLTLHETDILLILNSTCARSEKINYKEDERRQTTAQRPDFYLHLECP